MLMESKTARVSVRMKDSRYCRESPMNREQSLFYIMNTIFSYLQTFTVIEQFMFQMSPMSQTCVKILGAIWFVLKRKKTLP